MNDNDNTTRAEDLIRVAAEDDVTGHVFIDAGDDDGDAVRPSVLDSDPNGPAGLRSN